MNEPSRSSDHRKWQGVPPPAKDAPRSRGRVYVVAGGVMLLAGTALALFFLIRPVREPYFVGICIDQYADPRVPYRPWVANDREALLALPPWKDQSHDTFNQQERRLLQSTLKDLAKFRDRPLVVYLNAYALRNDRGEVYILPGDGRLDDPATWLPLNEVLTAIQSSPAPHKLLLLDIMQPLIVPELGLFDRVAPGELSSLVKRAVDEDSNLTVIGACTEGRNSLDLEEEKRSVFAYYVVKGLLGAADGWSESRKRDGRVGSQELAGFVAARVQRWTQHNLGRMQTPFVEGSDDFTFPAAGSADAADDGEPAEPEPYPDWMKDGWTRIDTWREQPSKRVPASVCSDLQTALLRVDRNRRRGQDPVRSQRELEGPLTRFNGFVLRAQLETTRAAPRSLEGAAVLGRCPVDPAKDGDAAKLAGLTRLEKQSRGAKPDPKLVEKWTAERDKFLEGYKEKPLDLAWLVWRSATGEAKPGRDAVRFWGGLLNAAWKDLPKMPVEAAYPESTFLVGLAKWAESYVEESWPLEAVRDDVAAVRAREQAAAEPNAPAWAPALREQAEKNRAEGERLLFAGSFQDAGMALHAALAEFGKLNQYLRILRHARQTADEATVLLSGAATSAERDGAVLVDWSAAVRMVPDVRRLISEAKRREASNLPTALRAIDTRALELAERLNKLGRPFQGDRIKKLLTPARSGESAELIEMEAALSGPWLTFDRRAELWKARCELAARLHGETLAEDAHDDKLKIVNPAGGAAPGETEWRERHQEELRRARVSIGMLMLLRNKDFPALERAYAPAAANPSDGSGWMDLVRELRRAWK